MPGIGAHAVLSLDPPRECDGDTVRFSATWRESDGSRQTLWWEVPGQWRDATTAWADPWLVGFIFPAMQRDRPVHVEGCVSPSLLGNLDLFMRVWQMWSPDRYRAVDIRAEREEELPEPREPGVCVASYSAGLDSNYSIYRHTRKLAGHRSKTIGAAVVQHGFDIRLNQQNSDRMFADLVSISRGTLDHVGVPCIPLKGNFRELDLEWPDAYGAHLVSGLSLLSGRFGGGIFPNDLPYNRLGVKPWPSHPVTNVMMESRNFRVIDDGGEASRIDKIRLVGGWHEAMANLRVCYGVAVPGSLDNCCRCEKCVRTLLAFRIVGQERPASFKVDPSDETIRRVRLTSEAKVEYWQELSRCAREAGLQDTSWARAIDHVLSRTRRRLLKQRLQAPFVPLRNAIRALTRHSTLSKSEAREEQVRKDRRERTRAS